LGEWKIIERFAGTDLLIGANLEFWWIFGFDPQINLGWEKDNPQINLGAKQEDEQYGEDVGLHGDMDNLRDVASRR
jgi:hypothetical protein